MRSDNNAAKAKAIFCGNEECSSESGVETSELVGDRNTDLKKELLCGCIFSKSSSVKQMNNTDH